eukprot:gene15262-21344_t
MKLAYTDQQRSEALKDALKQHYYSQFTFSPHINQRSKSIGRRHSLMELHSGDQERTRHSRERAVALVEQRDAAECTFKPTINPRSAKIAASRRKSKSSLLDGVASEQLHQARAARMHEVRTMREYEEMRECTFKPEVNKSDPKPVLQKASNSLPPGTSRYLELQALARKKKEEQKQREDKVWWTAPQGNTRLYTVPEPFSFEEREQQRMQQQREGASPEGRSRSRGRGDEGAQHKQSLSLLVCAFAACLTNLPLARCKSALDPVGIYGSIAHAQECLFITWGAATKGMSGASIPSCLRFAFHDGATYQITTDEGGANGSIMKELDFNLFPEHNGMAPCASVMQAILDQARADGCPELTAADGIQVVGAVSVSVSGGPTCDLLMGRPDKLVADDCTVLPSEYECNDANTLVTSFLLNGFTDPVTSLVVLSGSHNIAFSRVTASRSVGGCSGGKGAFTNTPQKFDGHYYNEVVDQTGKQGWLDSDKTLAEGDNPTTPEFLHSEGRLPHAHSVDSVAPLSAMCSVLPQITRAVRIKLGEGNPEGVSKGNEGLHTKLRKQVVDYMRETPDDFAPFVEDDETLESYLKRMQKDGIWAGNMEVVAACHVLKCNVVIHQQGSPCWSVKSYPDSAPTLHLSYHDGQHYNSVRNADDYGAGVPEPVVIKPASNRDDCEGDGQEGGEDGPSEQQVLMWEKALKQCGGDIEAAIEWVIEQLSNEVDDEGQQAEENGTPPPLEHVPGDPQTSINAAQQRETTPSEGLLVGEAGQEDCKGREDGHNEKGSTGHPSASASSIHQGNAEVEGAALDYVHNMCSFSIEVCDSGKVTCSIGISATQDSAGESQPQSCEPPDQPSGAAGDDSAPGSSGGEEEEEEEAPKDSSKGKGKKKKGKGITVGSGKPPPRNKACPCGSHQKYKNCCGKKGRRAGISEAVPAASKDTKVAGATAQLSTLYI